MDQPSLKQTPLAGVHTALGARMTPFGGFLLPLQYSGIVTEHLAVRTAVGLFDASHMGELIVSGPGATDLIDRLLTQEVRSLEPGGARYTAMLNEAGGILDDLLVYRLDGECWMLVVNAANTARDLSWIAARAGRATVTDTSAATALIAVQGPEAAPVVSEVLDLDTAAIRPYHFTKTCSSGFGRLLLSRTGYTGEDGFEIYLPAGVAVETWERLLAAGKAYGIRPCGLGARDTLRLEAGLLLYGQDMDEGTTPFDVGLDRIVCLEKEFIGRSALLAARQHGPRYRLLGFEMTGPGVARHGHSVYDSDGARIGMVTSGTYAPYLQRRLGLARVPATFAGEEIFIRIRGRSSPACRVALPFYHRQS